jgi:hypothetical protein
MLYKHVWLLGPEEEEDGQPMPGGGAEDGDGQPMPGGSGSGGGK